MEYISGQQAIDLDSLMVDKYHVTTTMLMENAGYRLAEFVRMKYPLKRNILILAGKGNNAGDGLCAARHLQNFGYNPLVFLATTELKELPKKYLDIAKSVGIQTYTNEPEKLLPKADLVIDCLLGFTLSSNPSGKFADLISLVNQSNKETLSCDTPSGIGADHAYEPHIKPSCIFFMAMPKLACKNLASTKYVGDIGVPKSLYKKLGLAEKNHFAESSILKLFEQIS